MAVRRTKPGRAAIYARISLDRTGAGLGVDRQVEDCMATASARCLDVVAVFRDNDISAFSGRQRPAYRRLLAAMEADETDVVIAWHTDRLHRSPRELEEYISISERHRIDTITVQSGELDLGTASGRMVARMLGAAARHESEQKSERIRRSRQQAAEAGRPNGHLGYGYNDDNTINVHQAEVVKEVAKRLISGETLYAVTSDLNARGIRSPRGRTGGWKSANLRGTITRATLAGWREWRPGTSTTKGGVGLGDFLAQGAWEPILTKKQVEKLRSALFNPERRTSRRPPDNLLTGVLICGLCQRGLNGSGDIRSKANPRRYRCIRQPGDSHCGRISIIAVPVESMVEAAVVEVLAGTRLQRARHGSAKASNAEIALLAARKDRDDLAIERAKGNISTAEWATMRRVLLERIAQAERAIAARGSGLSSIRNVPLGRAAREWWLNATIAQKRIVISTLIQSVEIGPAQSKKPYFDPNRVGDPLWLV